MSKLAEVERDPQAVLRTALQWREAGKSVALATVVDTWGSSPRPAGSNLVIAGDGSFEGSVSGGCVEGAVIEAAINVMQSGEQQILEFGVTDDEAWEVGLACGGQIRVLLEPIE
jgi:xanthine/CO dehydrogenase XdhC/CoxF family maturation factor